MKNNNNKVGYFGIFIILMIFIFIITTIQNNLWLLLPIAAAIIAIVFAIVAYRKSLRPKEVTEELIKIEAMDGSAFEAYTAQLLKYNGFSNVQITQASGDYGADVIGFKNNCKYVFQCKCYSSNLGVKSVQEIYSAKQHYNADIAVVIINTWFSRNAKTLAKETNVELWDKNSLIDLIRFSIKEKDIQKVQQTSKLVSPNVKKQNTPPIVYSNVDKPPIMSIGAITTPQPIYIQKKPDKTKELNMATRIGAGKYIFGENIPLGNYDLKIVSGYGTFKLVNHHVNHYRLGAEVQVFMNFDDKEITQTYTNATGKEGDFFTLDCTMIVAITKSNMIIIE